MCNCHHILRVQVQQCTFQKPDGKSLINQNPSKNKILTYGILERDAISFLDKINDTRIFIQITDYN